MAARKVVVIGGGLAGLSASIEAARLGSTVFLIDKEQRIGGNSAKASSGINGAPTATQLEYGIQDNTTLFRDDTLKSGGNLCQNELVDILVEQSNSAIEFLKSFGVHLDALSQCGGHSRPRTHRAKPVPSKPSNIGWEIISTLQSHVTNNYKDKVTIITNAKVTELLTDEKQTRVTGVKYMTSTGSTDLQADSVVLATGGYSADSKGFLAQFAPKIAQLSTTNGNFATGDGIRLAQKLGASLNIMDQVQIHPTSFIDPNSPNAGTKFLAPEALRGCGGILVNSKSERFVNELGLRDYVTREIFAHCEPMALENGEKGPVVSYLIMNDKAVEDFGPAVLNFYKSKGMVKVFGNAKELADAFHLDSKKLEEALAQYNEWANKGKDSFGKTVFPVQYSSIEPLHAMLITPSIHYTMGGIKVNDKAQVLKEDGSIIKDLFAAGEVTGGLHGANRLAGNSLLECVVFGRIAGSNSFKFE